MANKKKKNREEQSATQARPYMLVVAVILGGGVSASYWYRPLSSIDTAGSNAPGESVNLFRSQPTLIEPNTMDATPSNATVVPVYSALPADLVGDRQVELKPFQTMAQGTLKDRLAKEPLPVIPISRPEQARIDSKVALSAARPPIWTEMETGPSVESANKFGQTVAGPSGARLGNAPGKSSDWESASPWKSAGSVEAQAKAEVRGDRIVAIANPRVNNKGWPDADFNPESNVAQSAEKPLGAANPPLMVRGSGTPASQLQGRQAGKIVLAESTGEESSLTDQDAQIPRKSYPTSWSGNASGQGTPKAKKSGAVIRQPKQ